MKFCVALSLVALAAAASSADIVYTDIPDKDLEVGTYNLDLNGDGNADFVIGDFTADSEQKIEIKPADGSGNLIRLYPGYTDYCYDYRKGNEIAHDDLFSGNLQKLVLNEFYGRWGIGEFDVKKYVGVGLFIGGKEHMGWLGVENPTEGHVVLYDFAYESSADTPIVAGLKSTCRPDCDKDGDVDINDFICFQSKWRAKSAYGDYDGSGTWTVNDFVKFQADWRKSKEAGCE